MKKINVLLLSFVVLASFGASAQEDRAFSQGKSTVSVGYGLGNIWKSLFTMGSMFSTDGSYKTTSTGPFALQYEYGATDKISVGVQVGYSKVGSEYTDQDDVDFNYTQTLTNFGAIVRGNYHFGQSSKFDPYVGIGVGYYNFKYEYKSKESEDFGFAVPSAFGYSAQLGAKYYFAPTFGAYAEVGYVGGSIAQVGLTVKF
jgi:outer membrane protein W